MPNDCATVKGSDEVAQEEEEFEEEEEKNASAGTGWFSGWF